MARIFIAIKLSKVFKDEISDILSQLREQGVRAKYESPSNLHVTLAFIGETTQVNLIKQAIANIRFNPFSVSLDSIGCFQRNRVLWVGITNEKPLAELASSVRKQLDEIGVAYSPTPFKPHITIAREPSDLFPEIDLPEATMLVEKISVMETTHLNGKRVYVEQ